MVGFWAHAFWAGTAQKTPRGLCLGRRPGTVDYCGMAWWQGGTARARVVPGRRLDCSSLRNPPQVAPDAAAPCAVDVRVPQVQIEVEAVVAVLGEQPHLYRLI